MIISRRHLVIGAAAVVSASAAKTQKLVATSAQDLGPFYPILRPTDHDADLTRIAGRSGAAVGRPINVIGRIVDVKGNPISNAQIDLWQCNAAGRYAHPGDNANPAALDPNFQGFARLASDRDGGSLAQRTAISIKGLTPGVAYDLASCCHPIPGDRIVGLRREDEGIEVHVIGCDKLASGVDADWLDLAWGDGSDGGTARLMVILRDVAGALGEMAGIMGAKGANIVNLVLAHRDGSFHTFHVDVEVHDLAHLHGLVAALRAADGVSQVERI